MYPSKKVLYFELNVNMFRYPCYEIVSYDWLLIYNINIQYIFNDLNFISLFILRYSCCFESQLQKKELSENLNQHFIEIIVHVGPTSNNFIKLSTFLWQIQLIGPYVRQSFEGAKIHVESVIISSERFYIWLVISINLVVCCITTLLIFS